MPTDPPRASARSAARAVAEGLAVRLTGRPLLVGAPVLRALVLRALVVRAPVLREAR